MDIIRAKQPSLAMAMVAWLDENDYRLSTSDQETIQSWIARLNVKQEPKELSEPDPYEQE